MPRVAIVADTSLQRSALQRAVASGGYDVALNVSPAQVEDATLDDTGVDLWLVDLALAEGSPWVDRLLESTEAPVLYGESQAPERDSAHYPLWEKRLLGKLRQLVGDSSTAVEAGLDALASLPRSSALALPVDFDAPTAEGEVANEVWLLAGGLGAPQAVKPFLDALPPGLPVAFLYAQHIRAGGEQALAAALAQGGRRSVHVAADGEAPACGEVLIVPADRELRFDSAGRVCLADHAWPEPASPSIDRMLLNLVQRFGARCGAILFSGLGGDGSTALAYARRRAATIWAQQAGSCLHAGLPDSARATGHVAFSADPRGLAQAFVERLANQETP